MENFSLITILDISGIKEGDASDGDSFQKKECLCLLRIMETKDIPFDAA